MDETFSILSSTPEDIDRIMKVYDSAKRYMRKCGNFMQWTGGYPDKTTVLNDISNDCHYLAEDLEGNILMVFTFIIGCDPTYKVIEDGDWLNDMPYGTIHRIASNGRLPGMLDACVRFCSQKIGNIRIDTHSDNHPMQNALKKLNFKYCGVIYIADGSPRLAFQKDFSI